jgi:hypothetical protein
MPVLSDRDDRAHVLIDAFSIGPGIHKEPDPVPDADAYAGLFHPQRLPRRNAPGSDALVTAAYVRPILLVDIDAEDLV